MFLAECENPRLWEDAGLVIGECVDCKSTLAVDIVEGCNGD
jgi:hypothetical protein